MIDETVESQRTGVATHTDPDGTDTRRTSFEMVIGSNLFRNTNGVVKIRGKEQLVCELRRDQGLLLVTMDLYAQDGAHVAHLRRNVLALNQSGQFAVEIDRSHEDGLGDMPTVRVWDRRSGEMVLEAKAASEHKIQITSGKFYSHKGTLIEITPNYCRIGSATTLFGDIVESRGGMVVLGSESPTHLPARP
jgi:hypothetical protein